MCSLRTLHATSLPPNRSVTANMYSLFLSISVCDPTTEDMFFFRKKLTVHCSETGFGSAFLIFRPTIIVAEHEAKDAKAIFIDKVEKGIVAIGGV